MRKSDSHLMVATKIMIIEDDQDILMLYKDYLKRKGHNIIVSSTTADEALRDYQLYKPDLVIMDYRLPGQKNGLQAANDIISQYSTAKILIITASEGVGEEIVQMNLSQHKQFTVLIKPIRLSHLDRIISKILNDQQARV
jgi:DNA-binding NtrC family response regulator